MTTKIGSEQKKVLIIGAGFGGINLANGLNKSNYEVTLIDKNNYHAFQPLLYQVATGGLESGSIAYPVRRIFRKSKNIHFCMAEVQSINAEANEIETSVGNFTYDYLVLATGSTTNFYGLTPSSNLMMPLKSVPDALNLRSYILQNLEKAYLTNDSQRAERLINIAIVGGGPTGVETAGALAEMKRYILPHDYPHMNFDRMNINLYEAAPRLLLAMSEKSSEKALKYLQGLGVNVHLNSTVLKYTDSQLVLRNGDMFYTDTVIWSAGVKSQYPEGINAEAILPNGRLEVDEYNHVKGYNNIFAIGDIANHTTEKFPRGLPMVAPAAIQHGKRLAKNLISVLNNKPMIPFSYFDKGSMATVGINKAVVDVSFIHFGGFMAWVTWMFIHLLYLVGFRSKVAVLFSWIYSYITYDKALRLIIRPYVINKKVIEP
jgi:NADH dehydrogenase